MSNWKIDRRHFIASTGSVLLLPLLEGLFPRKALANGASDPARFVAMYMPDGTYNVPGDEVWSAPSGPLAAATVGEVLSPFTANLGDFSILKHINSRAADTSFFKFPNFPISLHQVAPMAYLTGLVVAGNSPAEAYIPGSSLDQIYAQASGKPSLVLAGEVNPGLPFPNNSGSTFLTLSYLNGKQLMPITYPGDLFKSMFAGLVPSTGPATPFVRNRSILDNTVADLNDLKSKLGNSDNQRLDDYLTSLRTLETKLAALPPVPSSQCQPIPAPDPSLDQPDVYGQLQNFTPKFQAFLDMIVLAFKCDLVRSVSIMYASEFSGRVLGSQIPTNLLHPALTTPQLQILESIQDHPYAHYQIAGLDKPAMVSRDRYRVSFMVYLINALKAAQDPSGSSILDNTILLNGYGVPDGMHGNSSHGSVNARPTVVAGGRNLGLHPGQSIEAGNYDMVDLCYSFSTHLKMGLSNFAGSNTVIAL